MSGQHQQWLGVDHQHAHVHHPAVVAVVVVAVHHAHVLQLLHLLLLLPLLLPFHFHLLIASLKNLSLLHSNLTYLVSTLSVIMNPLFIPP